jgi:hypothetical protein
LRNQGKIYIRGAAKVAFPNPFKSRAGGNAAQASNNAQQNNNNGTGQQQTTTNNQAANSTPKMHTQSSEGTLNLVNYTPEELVSHVDQRLERIQFGWSFATKLMENYSEVWSWIGPIILVIGTIGEVFLVLWLRQRVQDILAGVSIVAVALVLECTFLAVSYKAATIRNRAEKRPGGANDLDKKKIRRQLVFWCALGFGVCATQVIFIVAETYSSIPGQGGDIGTTGVWVFAILRALFTLVADGYTAFAHEEKPTTSERELEEQQQRTKAAEMLLQQKRTEINIINQGILDVREAAVQAQIRDDKMTTHLQIERMQNEGQIKALRAQHETADMTIQMLTRLQRALLDPAMDPEQRQTAINIMMAMGQGYSQLEAARRERESEFLIDGTSRRDSGEL